MEAEEPKRRGRVHWSEPTKTYPMSLIQQGWETLQLLDQLDYLTSSQVAKMLFWGQTTSRGHRRSLPAAQKAANEMCLRRLKDHGLVEVVPVADYPTPQKLVRHELNLLTRRGVELLKSHFAALGQPFAPNWNASLRTNAPLTFDHALRLNTVLANLVGPLRLIGGQTIGILNDRQIKSRIATKQRYLGELEPDALVAMRLEGRVRTFLIEVDTGSEPVRGISANRVEAKFERYETYLRERFVTDPFFRGFDRPQVLIVTSGSTRAFNLAELADERGADDTFRISTFAWITPPDRLATDAVWLVPGREGYYPLLS